MKEGSKDGGGEEGGGGVRRWRSLVFLDAFHPENGKTIAFVRRRKRRRRRKKREETIAIVRFPF